MPAPLPAGAAPPWGLEAPAPGEPNPDADWQHSRYDVVYLQARDVRRPISAYYRGCAPKTVPTRSGPKTLYAAELYAHDSQRRAVHLEVLLNAPPTFAFGWVVVRSNGRGLELVSA